MNATQETVLVAHVRAGSSEPSSYVLDIRTATRYNDRMIRSFRHRGLKRLYERTIRAEWLLT